MMSRERGDVLRSVQTLFTAGTAAGLSDGQLLERFLQQQDEAGEAAFAAVVERHGPMVLRVCRGVLHDPHAADDAFQATFLILARSAKSIRKQGSLASWLFGVARRVARRGRAESVRRADHERRGAAMVEHEIRSDEPPGLLPEVQEEVDRLPEKYRAPIVLCYLEGLTHEEAAGQLKLPVGTVKTRLSRGRERLRERLVRRGLAPAAVAAALAGEATAALPAPLIESTIKAAIQVAAGQRAVVSASVSSLVEGVLKAMFLTKLKIMGALFATSAMIVLSALVAIGILARPLRSEQAPQSKLAQADPPTNELAAPADDRKPTRVVVETLKKSDFLRTTTQPATIHPYESVDLYPGVTGILKSLVVDIGDQVKRGQTLAEIDAPEIEAEVRKSRAIFERAQALVMKAEAAIRVATAAVSAEENARAGGHAARLEEAKGRLEEARANHVAAKAELEVAGAALRSAEIIARRTQVVAPLEGVVTRRNSSVGSFVRSSAEAGSSPLLTIVQTSKVRVVVQVPDSDVPVLEKGDPASLRISPLGRRVYQGKVSRTAYAEDPQTRTVRVEIDLDNADGSLRPGQYGEATIRLEQRADVLTLPSTAIFSRTDEGQGFCYRVIDGRAVRTRVQLGVDNGLREEVAEGLTEGDTVVTNPVNTMKDGDPVEIDHEHEAPRKKD